MNIEKIKESIVKRELTHYGYLHDIGMVLENVSIEDLVKYYIHLCGDSGRSLRCYLEQKISEAELISELSRKF